MEKHCGVENHAVIDYSRRRLFDVIRELYHCRHHVLGNDDLHVNLHRQLVTDVSSVNLVAVRVLDNRGAVLDDMSFTSSSTSVTVPFFTLPSLLLRTRCTRKLQSVISQSDSFTDLTNHGFNALSFIAVRHRTVRCGCRRLTDLVQQGQPQCIEIDALDGR